MNNQQLVPPSRKCSTTPVGFGQGFLNKEQCDHEYPPYSPNLAPVDFFTCSGDWNEYWRSSNFVRLLPSIGMRRKSRNVFDRMASTSVPNTFTTVDRSVLLTTGLFWRKRGLNDWTVLYFWDITWFRGALEASTYRMILKKWGIYFTRKSLNKIRRPLSERLSPVSARGVRQFLNFI